MIETTKKTTKEESISSLVFSILITLCTFALIIAGFSFYLTKPWLIIPVPFRFIIGIIVFGISPGLLLFSLLNHKETPKIGLLSFLEIITISFAFSMLINIILFVSGYSLKQISTVYIFLQLIIYVILCIRLIIKKKLPHNFNILPYLRGWEPLLIVALIFLFTLSLFTIYWQGSIPVNPEELPTIRKLAENLSVQWNNITPFPDTPTTYLIAPFMVFIAGTSIMAHIDVALTYSMFWVFSTLVSSLCLVVIIHKITSDRLQTYLMVLFCILVTVFDINSAITSGVIAPYPNRYGMSVALLSLAILLFITIQFKNRISIGILCLITYLCIEMTFVHARETLYFLGFIIITAVVMIINNPSKYRTQLLSIMLVIGITITILFLYKEINLNIAPSLNNYVQLMSQATMKMAVGSLQNGFANILTPITEIPFAIGDGSSSLIVHVNTYKENFVDTWGSLVTRLIIPISILYLPFYSLKARSLVKLIFPFILSLLAVFLIIPFFYLSISALVGNPEILVSTPIILIATCLIIMDLVVTVNDYLYRFFQKKPAIVICSMLLFWIILLFLPGQLINLVYIILGYIWQPVFYIPLHLITMGIIIFKIRNNLPFGNAQVSTNKINSMSNRVFLGIFLFVILATPAVVKSNIWQKSPFDSTYQPPHKFSGVLNKDYEKLITTGLLPSNFYPPLQVIRYLRDKTPANQTILARDSEAITSVTPHYTMVLTRNGKTSLSVIKNWDFLKYQIKEGEYSLGDYLSTGDNYSTLKSMLSELQVDLVIADPTESESVMNIYNNDERFQQILTPIYDYSDYVIFQNHIK